MEPGIPSFEDVQRARDAVGKYLHRTPLHRYPSLCTLLGSEVRIKHENHHATGAFKVRGGVNLAEQLTEAERRAGLYTASTGNHGQSIAFAGLVTGTPVTVAVPEKANPTKVAAMQALGATVVAHGADFDTAREWITARAQAEGARFVGPTEPELIAGVASYALEIVEDWPEVEVIVVPVGAGSGAVGCCIAARTQRPEIQVIAVQAERAPAVYRSWREGRLVEAQMETGAEGLATRVPWANTLSVLRDPKLGLEDFVLVTESEIDAAIRLLLEHTHNLAEGAGAAAMAGTVKLRERLAGRRVAVVLSGANLDTARLAALLAG